MDHVLLLVGTVILICILMNRWVEKLAVPSLLVFIVLGMCFGENGLLHIQFDDYAAVNTICSVSLIFIMFYGGFGTNLTAARPVAVQSVVLSTLGVACTAGSVAVFVHLVFHLSWAESLLIGSVISSTDAASVFNILRTKKLALKEHTDSLLELESGSNDPISYMLTSVAVAVLTGQEISVPLLLLQQITLGAAGGLLLGRLSAWILDEAHSSRIRTRLSSSFLWSSPLTPCPLCLAETVTSASTCAVFGWAGAACPRSGTWSTSLM